MNEVDISEQKLFDECRDVLHALLKDHTRTAHELAKAEREGRPAEKDQWNIIWGTSNYTSLGESGFGERDEITEEKITGENRYLVRPRAIKDKEVQRQRSKDMAEVFTPGWVCNAQNNLVDEAWFGRPNAFNEEFVDKEGVHRWTATEGEIVFDEKPSRNSTRSWQDYVKDVRLEITCGEAPYLVSRYDSVTGLPETNLNQRVGLLDRKLRVVSENTATKSEWIDWAKFAVQSVYGFEWQGDNLLLAREAVLYGKANFTWYPVLAAYSHYAGYDLIWSRLVSRAFCRKLFPLFGVTEFDDFKRVVKNMSDDWDSAEGIHNSSMCFGGIYPVLGGGDYEKIGTMP